MTHIVTAPLVVATDAEGRHVYLYAGSSVPAGIPAAEIKRLTEGGFLAASEPPAGTPLTKEEIARVKAHESAPAGTSNPPSEVVRPAESGPGSAKDKWLAYAAAKGVEVDAEASKDDIVAAVTAAGH